MLEARHAQCPEDRNSKRRLFMTCRKWLNLLAVVSLLVMAFASPLHVSATATTLSPNSNTLTNGGDGGKPVGNLAVKGQSGTQGNWNKHIESTTPSSHYAGYRSSEASPSGVCTQYVATNGNDGNTGTLNAPWKTIQKAANTVGAGSTVCIRGGTYKERLTIHVSGSATGGYITFRSYPGEHAILDGKGLAVPNGWSALIKIRNKKYIIIRGLELRNYKTNLKNHIPIGILVTGYGNHIRLLNNNVHHIQTNYTGKNGGDAHGIAVYGTAAPRSLTNIIIARNKLHSLKLGSSESLVINGNVDGFKIIDNLVHDNNNIGIDAIGWEGTSPDPALDQARHGLIRGNTIYNIDSYGNPAYGNDRSADCIYVDGGTRITIERNVAKHCNLGIELASEHAGKATSYVKVRNNFVYNNTEAGIAFGGYDSHRGSTRHCTIVNNTLYNNDTHQQGNGEIYIQYDTRHNVVKNNVLYAGAQKLFIGSWSSVMTGNVIDSNLYYVSGNGGEWQWMNKYYNSFKAYRKASGNDSGGFFGINPLYVNLSTPDLHLRSGSPAIDHGQNLSASGSLDIDDQPRIQGGKIDLGADEVQ
jgi:hypothetical protein